MARYIDANKLQEKLTQIANEPDYQHEGESWSVGVCLAGTQLDLMPTEDVVPVVRCSQCKHSRELDKHCEINRNAYRHCALWRGEETINVWHKYTKHYNDYSIVEPDDYCSYGERKDNK